MSSMIGAGVASAKTLTIGIDVSTSNPVITSPEFAGVAAQFTRSQIAALQPGDVVVIRTLGDGGLGNIRSERIQITRRARADKVADKVARYIAGLPASGVQGQAGTNLVAFLEFGQFECASGGDILLLTDGVESSDYVSAIQFMAGHKLPAPEKNLLSGCNVTMLGFGRSSDGEMNPKVTKTIRASWQAWMKAAGARFNAIVNP